MASAHRLIHLGVSFASLMCNHEGQVVLAHETQTSGLWTLRKCQLPFGCASQERRRTHSAVILEGLKRKEPLKRSFWGRQPEKKKNMGSRDEWVREVSVYKVSAYFGNYKFYGSWGFPAWWGVENKETEDLTWSFILWNVKIKRDLFSLPHRICNPEIKPLIPFSSLWSVWLLSLNYKASHYWTPCGYIFNTAVRLSLFCVGYGKSQPCFTQLLRSSMLAHTKHWRRKLITMLTDVPLHVEPLTAQEENAAGQSRC